jgi:tRNA G18 (ribose-2'-O)-methylase SpoU
MASGGMLDGRVALERSRLRYDGFDQVMRRHNPPDPTAQYFGIGVLRPKTIGNVGGLWRSAHALGASLLFTIQDRLPPQARRDLIAADPALGQSSDPWKAWRSVPYLTFPSVEELKASLPLCRLVGVELVEGATDLRDYEHPERALYLLGSEIDGITKPAVELCDDLVQIPMPRSLNVSVTGAVVMYDRLAKR